MDKFELDLDTDKNWTVISGLLAATESFSQDRASSTHMHVFKLSFIDLNSRGRMATSS